MVEITEEIKDRLKSEYYSLGSPAAYSCVDKLFKAVNKEISKATILKWLRGELAHTLHKPRRVNFKRNYYEVFSINEFFQADIIDIASLAPENDGIKYILLVIDCLSRFVWVRTLKTRKTNEVLEAFKSIFNELDFTPSYLVTDREGSFFSTAVQRYFKSKGIRHYAPSSDTFKAAFAERAIKSYKNILFKMMTAMFTLRYVENVQKIADTMNARINRSINMAPKDVNYANQNEVVAHLKRIREKEKTQLFKNDIKIGDFVRIALNKTSSMEKGFLPNWSDELYKVIKICRSQKIPMYQLEDCQNHRLEGNFYNFEIQKVEKTDETIYRIDKILKHRVRKGVREVLVSWKNYKNPSWIPEIDLITS